MVYVYIMVICALYTIMYMNVLNSQHRFCNQLFFAPLIKSQQLLLQSSLLDIMSVMNLMLTECVWNKNLR